MTCLSSLMVSRLTLRLKHSYEEQAHKNGKGRQQKNITTKEWTLCDKKIEIISFVVSRSRSNKK